MSDSQPPSSVPGVPDQGADPVEWDPVARRFVPRGGVGEAPPAEKPTVDKGPDPRRYRIPSSAVGVRLDAQPGTPPPAGAKPVAPPVAPPVASPAPAPLPIARAKPPKEPKPPKPSGAKKPEKLRRSGKRRRFLPGRPKLRRVLLLLPLVIPIALLVFGVFGYFWARNTWNDVAKIPVKGSLTAATSGTNILIVGSDTRDGADPNDQSIVGGPGETADIGQRSDTMLVLHMGPGGNKIMSIPRDLRVAIPGHKGATKINAAYNPDFVPGGGAAKLIETIQTSVGIPINRYMEVNFETFTELVDAVGGITLDVPYPMFDGNTGLDIKQAGPHTFNGYEALQYVRSRHVQTLNDKGKLVSEESVAGSYGDLLRGERQRTLMVAVLGKIGDSKNPFTLMKVAGKLAQGIKVDDGLSMWDAARLAFDLRGLNPESIQLPVQPNGGDLVLTEPQAGQVIAQFK